MEDRLTYLGYDECSAEGRICKVLLKYIPQLTEEDADELLDALCKVAVDAVQSENDRVRRAEYGW